MNGAGTRVLELEVDSREAACAKEGRSLDVNKRS
jgi:hypothetical protein